MEQLFAQNCNVSYEEPHSTQQDVYYAPNAALDSVSSVFTTLPQLPQYTQKVNIATSQGVVYTLGSDDHNYVAYEGDPLTLYFNEYVQVKDVQLIDAKYPKTNHKAVDFDNDSDLMTLVISPDIPISYKSPYVCIYLIVVETSTSYSFIINYSSI